LVGVVITVAMATLAVTVDKPEGRLLPALSIRFSLENAGEVGTRFGTRVRFRQNR
jgi:hypothetical protein